MPKQPRQQGLPTQERQRTMVLATSIPLFVGVIAWATITPGTLAVALATITALGAVIAATLVWHNYYRTGSLLLTVSTAIVPLVGFATEASSTSSTTEVIWLMLSFVLGAVTLSAKHAIVGLSTLWVTSSILLLINQGIPTAAAFQTLFLLGIVCAVMCGIAYRGAHLEKAIYSKQREARTMEELLLTRTHELDSALHHEQTVSRLKEDLLASLSHELRTPLNAILGLSEALQEEVYGPLSEMQRKSLETIESSGRHLLQLVRDILDFARIGAGRLSTNIQPFDPNQIIQVSARRVRNDTKDKGINFSVHTLDPTIMVHSDSEKCQRVIDNLLSNAIKFTEKGGKVGIELETSSDGETISIHVWDTGIGISTELQARLFQPFEQGDGGLDRKFGGMGLGLALSTRLTHLLGASLKVKSTLGSGSRFTFTIPISGPRRIKVYGDLNCPFSYTLNEWFDQVRLSHLVDWCGVEHMTDLTQEISCTQEHQDELTDELERVSTRANETHVAINRPPFRPNSHLGLIALRRIERLWPEQVVAARRSLFKAVWKDGKDISQEAVIEEILPDFELSALNKCEAEAQELVEDTKQWRQSQTCCIPMVQSETTDSRYEGLGQRSLLINFISKELGFRSTDESAGGSKDLTRQLMEENMKLRIGMERLKKRQSSG